MPAGGANDINCNHLRLTCRQAGIKVKVHARCILQKLPIQDACVSVIERVSLALCSLDLRVKAGMTTPENDMHNPNSNVSNIFIEVAATCELLSKLSRMNKFKALCRPRLHKATLKEIKKNSNQMHVT